jgi:hypothetical protein
VTSGSVVASSASLDRLNGDPQTLPAKERRNVAEKLIEKTESAVDREIVFTRVFDAPRRMVWEAWTDPKQLVLWWGPRGFTTTIDEMDLRAGGVWKLVMHGPDGTDYPNKNIFTEVVPYERLRYRLSGGAV